MWIVCSCITLVDMLSTLRVSFQIDGSSHAQLAGMHVSRDVSRRKLHEGLRRNVSDLHAITCHGCCCVTCGRKWTAWPCKAVVPVWIMTQSCLRPHTDAHSYWESPVFNLFTLIYSPLDSLWCLMPVFTLSRIVNALHLPHMIALHFH